MRDFSQNRILRARRKPLVTLTPKSLLRARSSRSAVDDLVAGRFREVLDDPGFDAARGGPGDVRRVRRVLVTSGKVAHDAIALRDAEGFAAAVVRVEQLYPWPELVLLDTIGRYPNAEEVVWLQEEPENMGPWNFVHGRLHRVLRDRMPLRHVSRAESASPATGSHTVHQREQADLLTRAFAGL